MTPQLSGTALPWPPNCAATGLPAAGACIASRLRPPVPTTNCAKPAASATPSTFVLGKRMYCLSFALNRTSAPAAYSIWAMWFMLEFRPSVPVPLVYSRRSHEIAMRQGFVLPARSSASQSSIGLGRFGSSPVMLLTPPFHVDVFSTITCQLEPTSKLYQPCGAETLEPKYESIPASPTAS